LHRFDGDWQRLPIDVTDRDGDADEDGDAPTENESTLV
jgi:hypothetical protein